MEAAVRNSWRDGAISWIRRGAASLPETPPTNWHVRKPTYSARSHAMHIVRHVPPYFSPVELSATLDQGIAIEWRNGRKELELEIFADGSIEIEMLLDGSPINPPLKIAEPDWAHLGSAFAWIESS
jgi:hypothetical protein